MKLKQIFLLTNLILFSIIIEAQDLIYKKNGEIVEAKILDQTAKSLSYKLYNQAENTTYYINFSVIDSIIYHKGEKEKFQIKSNVTLPQKDNQNILNNHHLIGTDISQLLFNKNILISYEYLPTKIKFGIKGAFAVNLNPQHSNTYTNLSLCRNVNWSLRFGMNYYFFPPRTFRVGTGLYYIFGSYTHEEYIFSENYSNSRMVITDHKIMGTVLSIFAFYNINKNLAINIGYDAPLHINSATADPSFRLEIMLNF